MVGLHFDSGALHIALATLENVGDEVEFAGAITGAAADVLFDEVRRNLSYTDHTPRDFRRLDHPYARRHGKIQVHGGKQRVVHRQSGTLLGALRKELLPSGPDGARWSVWLDADAAPHAYYVILGTKKMLPRDSLWETAKDPRAQRLMMRAV